MGPAETTGIVIVVVAVVQGIFKFAEHLIAKYGEAKDEIPNRDILELIRTKHCGLNEQQSGQLRTVYDLLNSRDGDGTPLSFVPRSWATTQREIVAELRNVANELRSVAETQHKTLNIIERLENRLERLDS